MLKKIILLSGPVAVGKTSIAESLEREYGFKRIKSSQYLINEASSLGIEVNRLNLQNLGDQFDEETDFLWVVNKVTLPIIESIPNQNLWLFDSVRKQRQVEHFKLNLPPEYKIYHIHITASEETIRNRFFSRDPSLPQTSYTDTINHPNEISARNLIAIADHAIKVDEKSSDRVLCEISQFLELAKDL